MTDRVREWMKDGAPTPSVDEFLAVYNADDNVWWMLACGHHQNLFDAAAAELELLRAQRDAALAVMDGRDNTRCAPIRAALGVQPEPDETRAPEAARACEGFKWLGQSFASCDGCGQPYWEHTHNVQQRPGTSPFAPDAQILVPIAPEQADRCRRKWCPTCSGPSRETVGMVCQTCGTDYGSTAAAGVQPEGSSNG